MLNDVATQEKGISKGKLKIEVCRICKSDSLEYVFSEEISGIAYQNYYCRNCDLYQTAGDVAPVSPDYINLTNSQIDAEHLFTQRKHKEAAFQQWMSIVSKYTSVKGNKSKLVDIGCGVGGFLDFAAAHGFQAFGFDASLAQIKIAKSQHPTVRHCTTTADYLREFPELLSGVDLVTLWDVLEHIRDPGSFLLETRELLAENGLVFASVPNGAINPIKIKLAKLAGRPAGLIPWEHVFYYTKKSIEDMFARNGFRVIAVGGVKPYKRQKITPHEVVRRFSHNLLLNTRYAFQIYAIATPGN